MGEKTNPIPELQGVHDKTLLDLLLNRTLRGRGPRERISSVLLTRFASLVDQVVHEYGLAHSCMGKYIETDRLQFLFRSTGHIETSLNLLHRALQFAEAVRRRQRAPDISREAKGQLRTATKWVKDVRDHIEHMDERILDPEFPPGMAVTPIIRNEQLEIADTVISLRALTGLIEFLHNLASTLGDAPDPAE